MNRHRTRPQPYAMTNGDPDAETVDMEEYEREAREKLEDELCDDDYAAALGGDGESYMLRGTLAKAVRAVVAAGPDEWQGAIDKLREVHESIIDRVITPKQIQDRAEQLFNDAWDEAEDNYGD